MANGKAKRSKEKAKMNWRRYERYKATKHRGRHVGGPGEPDYVRGRKRGEVRNRRRPMTRPEVKTATAEGIVEIDSLGGFTKPAVEYIAKYRPNVKLFSRGRRIG